MILRKLVLAVVVVALAGLTLAFAAPSAAAILRPLHGDGNFSATFDLVNQWDDDGSLHLVVAVAVANREINLKRQKGGRYEGELRLSARLEGPDGTVIEDQRLVAVRAVDETEAFSGTLFQIASLVLRDLALRTGTIVVTVEDMERKRPGLINLVDGLQARSEAVADWSAPDHPREPAGLAVGDPVFLAGAPVGPWARGEARPLNPRQSALRDHLHPTRRYGLEQERLQVYFELYPELGQPRSHEDAQLLLQLVGDDPPFAFRDTLTVDPAARAALMAGRPAGVFYEVDVNILPPGSFRLAVAPADARGRGVLAGFDVVWRLAVLDRRPDELLGEGRTVLPRKQLGKFLAASDADREVMLEEFWRELDPDPATPVNERLIEFRRRVAYVREHLGGFGAEGAVDPRGEVYVLLGPPDEVRIESIPLNEDELDDARVKVFDRYAPDREGSAAKGGDPGGTEGANPYSRVGGFSMPYSRLAEKEMLARRTSPARLQGFELWRYDQAGDQLFRNKYTDRKLGLRFLFVDRTGSGDFVLESSNAFRIGGSDPGGSEH
ncbi:MAG: GWxTD domain-containing protein [Candidatus Krumholzibacteriia bacterium]